MSGDYMKKGILFIVLATTMFGITPIFGKMTYNLGSNGINLALLRHLFVLPVFLLLSIRNNESLKLTKKQLTDLLKVSFLGSGITVVLLYSSYSYIPVGCATTLHFLYPLFVCGINALFYNQKLNFKQLCTLILAIVGVFCFMETGQASLIGYALSILSGLTFAYYIICVDHSSINTLPIYVFNFYLAIFNSILIGSVGIVTKSIVLLPLMGYVLSFVVSILASFVGVVFLQKGIQYLGANMASILSALEPITSILFGVILLNESFTIPKLIGCFLVLLSTFLIIRFQSTKNVV